MRSELYVQKNFPLANANGYFDLEGRKKKTQVHAKKVNIKQPWQKMFG